MSARGITLEVGTVVVLDLDGTLVYIEDVQPTGARVIALPEQLPDRKDTAVFTPGRVGAKVISPYSSASRVVAVAQLSERNREFIGTYEVLRTKHGPNFVARTPEEEAQLAVIKAKQESTPRVHKGGRGAKASPEDKKAKRQARKAAKIPCVKCGKAPVHADHQFGNCEYEAPPKKTRGSAAPSASDDADDTSNEPATGKTYHVTNTDLSSLQAENDKFAKGNRFYRVFVALCGLPGQTGTLAQVIAAVIQDNGKPMTDPEKVSRRALRGLVKAGNVELV